MISAKEAQALVIESANTAYGKLEETIKSLAGYSGSRFTYSQAPLLPEHVAELEKLGYTVEMTNIGQHKISW